MNIKKGLLVTSLFCLSFSTAVLHAGISPDKPNKNGKIRTLIDQSTRLEKTLQNLLTPLVTQKHQVELFKKQLGNELNLEKQKGLVIKIVHAENAIKQTKEQLYPQAKFLSQQIKNLSKEIDTVIKENEYE